MINGALIRKKCKIAIDNIIHEGTTDVEIFDVPFELNYLKLQQVRNEMIDFVVKAISENKFEQLKIHKIGHVLVPKKDLCDFRKCAWIDVRDEIIYLTLALLLAEEIEKSRIPKTKNRVFSYRLQLRNKPYLFDAKFHFTSFRNEVNRKKHIRKNKVLVECDISNFYDRINIHRIESSLFSFPNLDPDIIKLINELLLYWANRDSYGLPVGSNASRILAEASLVNVDSFLRSHEVDFCRFVDDYRIFAKDADTAHKHLALLTECLSREGLFINTQKTRMLDISDKIKVEAVEKTQDETEHKDSKSKIDLPKVIRGYNGLIPTKFRKLSQNEIEEFRNQDIDLIFTEIEKSVIVKEEDIKRVVKMIDAQEEFSYIYKVAQSLKKFPQFIPYFVDFLTKKTDNLSEDVLQKVKDLFGDWYREDDVPEYILVYLVRLFKINAVNKKILLDAFRNSKRTAGDYIGRALLESFNGILTRTEVMEIREYYVRADIWEKRQILRLVQCVLPDGEKRPFFKDVKIHNTDPFIDYIIDSKQDFLKITLCKKASVSEKT